MSNYQLTQSVVQGLLKDKNIIIDKFNSNRIVSIPQDIKLELNDGTLILKAGSKVYIPNGKNSDDSNKFDAVTIENDVTYSAVYTSSRKCYALYDYSTKRLQMIALTDSRLSYDSTTNKVIHTEITDNVLSFPFALVVRDTTGIGSVNQIFNSFGYIGSTCYILPGIINSLYQTMKNKQK